MKTRPQRLAGLARVSIAVRSASARLAAQATIVPSMVWLRPGLGFMGGFGPGPQGRRAHFQIGVLLSTHPSSGPRSDGNGFFRNSETSSHDALSRVIGPG